MAHYLVIVESPAKVKTIKKFLGKNYTVAASNGHVRDLPKSQLGIDVEHDYEPKYITSRGKGDIRALYEGDARAGKVHNLYHAQHRRGAFAVRPGDGAARRQKRGGMQHEGPVRGAAQLPYFRQRIPAAVSAEGGTAG